MTTPKWFEPKITVGNVIQIVLLLAAVAGAWFGIIGRVDGNDKDIANLQAQVSAITSIATRVTVIETTIASGRANRDKQISDINQRVSDNQSAVETKLDKIADSLTALSSQVSALNATLKAQEDRRP